jgi:hypothetical protein
MALCLSCLGQKKIQGMGFMGEVECKTCKGTGLAPVTVEIKAVEQVVEPKVETLEIRPEHSVRTETLEIKPTDSWSSDALTMKGGHIGKTETLELAVEEEAMHKTVEPKDSNTDLVNLERLKRKYTKSSK